MENPIKMDDLVVTLFSETSVYKCMGHGPDIPGAASHSHCCLSDCFVHLQRIAGQLVGAWKIPSGKVGSQCIFIYFYM